MRLGVWSTTSSFIVEARISRTADDRTISLFTGGSLDAPTSLDQKGRKHFNGD